VCLYLADIGDNDRKRPFLTVYVVVEPRLDETARTIASRSFRYRYPNRPDVSPDGTTLAVRTYYEVFFYRAMKEHGSVVWSRSGTPCFLGEAESQGEAIAYLDRDTLLLTSERGRGRAGLIHRLRC